jgi:hypothetical protein
MASQYDRHAFQLRHVSEAIPGRTVIWINDRVGNRLAELLTKIHGDNPLAFVAQERADLVTNQFSIALTVAGAVGVLT